MDVPSFRAENQQSWQKIVSKYQSPHMARSIWQLINTLTPYMFLWYVLVKVLDFSFWWMLPLSVLASGLPGRIFIIFHDCGHDSFLKSQKANSFWGFITGVLTFTPYQCWRHEHAVHHSHAGDLGHREVGEVWTMTVKKYFKSSYSPLESAHPQLFSRNVL